MEETLSILLIRHPTLPPPLPQRTTQIPLRQPRTPIPRRTPQQFLHQLQIRTPLILHKRHIPPRQTRIMLNRIMPTQILKIKRPFPITPSQKVRSKLRHEKAEARREIEGLAYGGVERAEGDVFAVVREDAVVGQGVEHWACGARVAGFGRGVGRPVACVAWGAGGDDVCGGVGGEEEVEEEEGGVPG